MNELLFGLLGNRSLLQIDRPYWAVKLDDDTWVSEAVSKIDLVRGIERLTDWSADVVANDLTSRIRELWMFCPASRLAPTGNTVRVPILPEQRAIQFKNGSFDTTIVAGKKMMAAMIVGRLDDRASGECTCFVWDCQQQALYVNWKTNLYRPFGKWREDGPPVPALSPAALGIVG